MMKTRKKIKKIRAKRAYSEFKGITLSTKLLNLHRPSTTFLIKKITSINLSKFKLM